MEHFNEHDGYNEDVDIFVDDDDGEDDGNSIDNVGDDEDNGDTDDDDDEDSELKCNNQGEDMHQRNYYSSDVDDDNEDVNQTNAIILYSIQNKL